jgi:integral membrane protein
VHILEEVRVWESPVGRVRGVGFIEGISALILFFVAMPLKYLSSMPETGSSVVTWVGSIHGGLFILYAAVTLLAWRKGRLSLNLVGLAAIASIVPFGPFVIDGRLKAVEREPSTSHECCGTGQTSYDDTAD